MDIQDKTKEDLIKELQELQQEHDALRVSYEADVTGYKQAEEQNAIILSTQKSLNTFMLELNNINDYDELVKKVILQIDQLFRPIAITFSAYDQDARVLRLRELKTNHNTGLGIPKERQQAIFDRFVQADIEDKEARQGAGLGLAITKAYVEMLGGSIRVESEEGKGSTFYFTIPYKKEHLESDSQEQEESGKEIEDQAKSLKILIVEDDKLSAMLISKYVQKVSKEILQADSGTKAVAICKDHPDIDLILMDIKMPGMDGEEATRQIRKFNKDVVIIAQTAKALTGDRAHAMEVGFNDYITKPINKTELLQCVEKNIASLRHSGA